MYVCVINVELIDVFPKKWEDTALLKNWAMAKAFCY